MNKKIFLFLIIVISVFFRFFRVAELAKFNYDEARDSIIERKMIIDKKITLLGPETKIGNKTIYFGPLHYYLMTPALGIINFNPLGPYFWTAALGVATTFFIYLLTRSLFSSAFYAVFPVAVIFNRWAWNPNTIPLFATLFLLFLFKRKFILSGLMFGLVIQLHFTAAGLALVILYKLVTKKLNLHSLIKLLFGLSIGLAPMIIFDLRHDFLYIKSTLSLLNPDLSYRGLNWHYFLWLIPIFAYWLKSWPRALAGAVIGIFFCTSLYWLIIQKPNPVMHPDTIKEISKIISKDQKKSDLNFNVASFVDPDARATAYRYFLDLEGVSPLGVGQYGVSDHLYVISFDDSQKVLYNQTYEISSFAPKRVSKTWRYQGENIYRLERN